MEKKVSEVQCPKCGSTQIQLHERKKFGWGRGCLGFIIFWPLILLGLTKKSKIQRICLNCRKIF